MLIHAKGPHEWPCKAGQYLDTGVNLRYKFQGNQTLGIIGAPTLGMQYLEIWQICYARGGTGRVKKHVKRDNFETQKSSRIFSNNDCRIFVNTEAKLFDAIL